MVNKNGGSTVGTAVTVGGELAKKRKKIRKQNKSRVNQS